ncbi:MAG: TraB/GumN family protein [Flavobacterium sp.]|nr:TraB/GumN family protein [Flavobacterium sp.]
MTILDSIYKLAFSKKAHEALIINRNKIMADSISSISKRGSLFAAVGAAHLAGNEGIINLLLKKDLQ